MPFVIPEDRVGDSSGSKEDNAVTRNRMRRRRTRERRIRIDRGERRKRSSLNSRAHQQLEEEEQSTTSTGQVWLQKGDGVVGSSNIMSLWS